MAGVLHVGAPDVQAVDGERVRRSSLHAFVALTPTNRNVCLTAFVEPGNLADALQAFSRNSKGAMATLPKPLAKSMRVTTTYLGYKKTRPLKAIGTTSARNTFFALGDDKDKKKNEKISVENYFFRRTSQMQSALSDSR